MREVVVDTETTGLEPSEGHRIVEIGCVELVNHIPTEKVYRQYVNPDREISEGAYRVHRLGMEFLSEQPRFGDIAGEFLDFIGDAPLIMHNAPFDLGFLNAELGMTGRPALSSARVIDTLEMARSRYRGASNSLDALCRRFGIDTVDRADAHGALLDATLLADVYLELIGGRQPNLDLVVENPANPTPVRAESVTSGGVRQRPERLPERLSDAERQAHLEFVNSLGRDSVWASLGLLDDSKDP
ncbi:MAG: DNA polymerase III subunit epsilon [Paracoccaceae bacterium]|nr:DNA polymerase III subunit epsilon [Paracoccaceae bacterium]